MCRAWSTAIVTTVLVSSGCIETLGAVETETCTGRPQIVWDRGPLSTLSLDLVESDGMDRVWELSCGSETPRCIRSPVEIADPQGATQDVAPPSLLPAGEYLITHTTRLEGNGFHTDANSFKLDEPIATDAVADPLGDALACLISLE